MDFLFFEFYGFCCSRVAYKPIPGKQMEFMRFVACRVLLGLISFFAQRKRASRVFRHLFPPVFFQKRMAKVPASSIIPATR